jgi:hypothetical protein
MSGESLPGRLESSDISIHDMRRDVTLICATL